MWPQAREEMDRLQGQRRSEVVSRIRDTSTTLDEVTRSFDERRRSRPGSAAPHGGQVCTLPGAYNPKERRRLKY